MRAYHSRVDCFLLSLGPDSFIGGVASHPFNCDTHTIFIFGHVLVDPFSLAAWLVPSVLGR